MSEAKEERPQQPSMLARAEEIQQQIQQLSGRDWQLWSIGLLLMLVLTGGVLALTFPNLMWAKGVVRLEHSYLPQLFFGLISLILLVNIYMMAQKLTLNSTRRALIRELVLNERLENLSLIDPLTQLLNRRAMNEMIPREVARANRVGSGLTFMSMDLDGFREVNAKFGTLEGDQLLVEFSRILKTIFRGADVVFRQGGDEFMVLMPDTTEDQAEYPIQRLQRAVEQWNLAAKREYEMAFSWALAPYITGNDYDDVLRAVDRKLYQKKNNLVPVF
jgi:diguanylate cyclase (GGDEF)-like protein